MATFGTIQIWLLFWHHALGFNFSLAIGETARGIRSIPNKDATLFSQKSRTIFLLKSTIPVGCSRHSVPTFWWSWCPLCSFGRAFWLSVTIAPGCMHYFVILTSTSRQDQNTVPAGKALGKGANVHMPSHASRCLLSMRFLITSIKGSYASIWKLEKIPWGKIWSFWVQLNGKPKNYKQKYAFPWNQWE